MRRSEVESWINSGPKPGQKGPAEEDYVDIPNPDPKRAIVNPTVKVKRVTWTRNDGQVLSVLDYQRRDQDAATNDFTTNPDGTKTYDPDYQSTRSPAGSEHLDARSPEVQANEEELNRQRKKNASYAADQDPQWETDAQRAERARQTRIDQDAAETRRLAAQTAAGQLQVSQGQLGVAQTGEARAGQAEIRQQQTADASIAAQAAQTALERDKYNLDREKANKPEVISKPTDADSQVAIFDPSTGKVVAQENPIYNAIKVAAQQKKEELALGIQARTLTLNEATQQYNRWYQDNVETPLKQAQERRAQAESVRLAQEAQDKREQFASSQQLQTAQLGETAGQHAAQNEIALMPYRVGAGFSGDMANSINSLAQGGNLNHNASAGVHFGAGDFQFNAPDLQAVAARGTAAALKGISAYDPDVHGPIATPDYTGINFQPQTPAPSMPAGGPDISQMWQQLYGATPYQPPTGS